MNEETIKMLNMINDKIKKCMKDNDVNTLLAIPLGGHGEFGYLTNEMLDEIIQLQQENQQLKEQRQELRSWLEEEKNRLARECSQIYEDSLGKTRLVNEDIFNEVNKILSKLNELEGGKND